MNNLVIKFRNVMVRAFYGVIMDDILTRRFVLFFQTGCLRVFFVTILKHDRDDNTDGIRRKCVLRRG